jgi:anti-sigma regulatory factor (Ser/Thr protein kinase)
LDDPREEIFAFTLNGHLSEINVLSGKLQDCRKGYYINAGDFHDISLVLEEWFTNLVRYGLANDKETKIRIEIKNSKTELDITVTDEGQYFDPRDVRLPDLKYSLDKRSPGGIGLHLIFNLMDTLSYQRVENKNILHMKKMKSTHGSS